MKRSTFTTLLHLALMLCFTLLVNLPLWADDIIKEEITEGKEYWLGLPHCNREAGEAIRGTYPIAIWISSKVDTRATIEDAETGSIKNYTIRANEITEVPYGDAVMMTDAYLETPKNYGIHVTADDPISVAVYMSYRWSGEAYRVTPVEWLGKKYVTLNLYQDETDKILPCQILVVATADNTVLKYRPRVQTAKLSPGQLGTVTLQKGDCFLIENKKMPGFTQDDKLTDLTGTYLDATKPIAVISGHTKGAFPKLQKTFLGRPGNFMRNMMIDMMWPIELLGTDYISAPYQYADRPRGVIQDDVGDLIRFVAAYDSTFITQLRQDGSSYKTISPKLNRGDHYDIINQDLAALYHANKPVLVGQYGKTWLDHLPTPIADKGGDQSQNPSRNGQGQLVALAPLDHWTSYASFRAPTQIDDWVYLTFDAKYLPKLKWDGVPFTAKFGSSVKYINGTNYCYLTLPIAAGDHWILGDTIDGGKDKAVFAGYAYGNWDRSKDGFAYAYPIGINYNTPCEDSLYVTDNQECGNVTGGVFCLPVDADCAGILKIDFDAAKSSNYDFSTNEYFSGDKKATFELKVIDLSKDAIAYVTFMTRSGKTIHKTYTYTPEKISANPTYLDFGLMKIGDTKCLKFTVTNSGSTKLTVKNLRLMFNKAEFNITTKSEVPFDLDPNQTKEIEVCATAITDQPVPVKDSVIADLSCYPKTLTGLSMRTGNPVVYIFDQNWGQVPVGNEVAKQVNITNKGNIPVELYSIDWADKTHFTKIDGLPVNSLGGTFTSPLTIDAHQTVDFTVYYKPNKFGVQDSTTAFFTGNTDVEKLYSAWVGIGTEPGPEITGYDWLIKRVIDNWAGVPNYGATIQLKNMVGNADVTVTDVIIEGDNDGVFSLDKTNQPTTLKTQTATDMKVYFAPKAEKEYTANVTLICKWNGGSDIRKSAILHGIGKQPHYNITGHDYGPAVLVGKSVSGNGQIYHVTNVYPMELTLSSIRIEDANGFTDKAAFVIDPAYLADKSKWGVIPIGGSIDVPITFTASHPGEHQAQLVADADSPDQPSGLLIGLGLTEGLVASDHDHGRIFVSTKNNGQVFLTNTGSEPITIQRDIRQSVSGDANTFNIIGWQTAKTGIKNQSNFDLNPGDTLYVNVEFMPNTDKTTVDAIPSNIQDYKATIEYQTSGGLAYSILTGQGMILKTVASIPKDQYKSNPGTAIDMSFNILKDGDEAKALSTGNITEFKAKVYFKDMSRVNIQDVYPAKLNQNDALFGVKDIITSGTMTDGWTILPEDPGPNADTLIIDRSVLQIHFKSKGQPLNFTGTTGTLFKFKMNTYLSDLDTIKLPCDLTLLDQSALYTIVTNLPGNVLINPVCVNTLRLIQLTNVQYTLSAAQPNPAQKSTTINYSVGLDHSPTSIVLYNMSGEKVADLVSGELKAGQYELKIDVDALNLPSGVYQYRMLSGPYIETQSLVITK